MKERKRQLSLHLEEKMNFRENAYAIQNFLTDCRHHIHRNPELSFKEWETTRFIVEKLTEMGIDVTTFEDYPGCIAHIGGKKPGRTVFLRADIDALPMEEHSGVDYASNVPGVMHACGHDVHTTSLLGAAKLLKEVEDSIPGKVELLFQSGEECFVGSQYYIKHHCFDSCDFIYGMHVWPGLEDGNVDFSDGNRMAACDNFVLKIHGKSAHGSTPNLGKDAIVCASAMIMNLQSIASRWNDPMNPLVVSVGMIKAGTAFNILCDEVELEGTVRTYDRDIHLAIDDAFRNVVESTAKTYGCTVDIQYDKLEPAVVNDHAAENEIARGAVAKLFGKDAVAYVDSGMGSEDFSQIMEVVPGAFGFLGIRDEEYGAVWPLHSDHFRVNDDVLPIGAATYAQVAYDYLEAFTGEEK